MRTYSELLKLQTFEGRFNYLSLGGIVGDETFGFERYFNQKLYSSEEWRQVRRFVIVRDDGCDLGIPDLGIKGHIYVHHMNPISLDDIESHNPDIFDPEYLITVSLATHNAIHYGDANYLKTIEFIERKPGDTCLWR